MSKIESFRERIQAASDRTNWSEVSNAEVRSLTVSLELQEDAESQLERRSIAWGTAAGGVISLCVVTIFALVTTKSAEFTLGLVTTHQLVRQLILWWKRREAQKQVRELALTSLTTAVRLSEEHPA